MERIANGAGVADYQNDIQSIDAFQVSPGQVQDHSGARLQGVLLLDAVVVMGFCTP